ncbi:MAG: sigma-E processing peptidase SpoIIGA [Firmicutes bacterium]|nr:sigma-E processing peptidase SpoIIGA [Bacillota bacterium]
MLEISVPAYALLAGAVALQVYLLLWATAAIARLPVGPWWMWLGAVFAAAYDVVVDLGRVGALPFWPALGTFPAVAAASLFTFALAFWQAGVSRWRSLLAYYYGLAFLSFGATMVAKNFYPSGWVGPATSILVILLAAELGWGVVQRWVWERTVYVPVRIRLFQREVAFTALVDTGHNLRDPLSASPVIILAAELSGPLLGLEDAALQAVVESDYAAATELLAESPLLARVRLIPFSSLGQDSGILLAVRLDEMWVGGGRRPVRLENVLAGFHHRSLSPDRSYQALIHPDLLENNLGDAAAFQSRWSGQLAESARARRAQ